MFNSIKIKILFSIVIFLLIGGSLSFAYYKGYTASEIKFSREKLIADNKYQEELLKAQSQKQIVEKRIYVKDLETVRELEKKNQDLTNNINSLQKRIVNYVPKEVANYKLSNGAVSVFDNAAKGETPNHNNSPTDAANLPNGQDSTPSNVNGLDASQYAIEIAGRYNQARNQCNALIDWVDENIVKK